MAVLIAAAASLMMPFGASASGGAFGWSGATFTWTGAGTDINWSDAANWNCTGAPCTAGSTPISIPESDVDFPSDSDSDIDKAAVVHSITIASPTNLIEGLAPLTVDGPAELTGIVDTGLSGQTYNGPVVLTGGGAQLFAVPSTVTFARTVDSSSSTPEDLDVMGNAKFDGAVGGEHALGELVVANSVALGANVTTTGGQLYESTATVRGAPTVTAPNVEFISTVDGAASLTIDGNAIFQAAVGGLKPLKSLTVTGTTGGYVTTTGTQNYEGPIDGGSFTASTVTFHSTVNGSVTVNGDAQFDVDVTATILAVNGTAILPASVSAGEQTYSGTVILGSNTTLSGYVMFASGSTVNSSSATPVSLTLLGPIAWFDGKIGTLRPLGTLTVGGQTLLDGRVNTTGAQSYGQVWLTGDSSLHARGVTLTGMLMSFGRSLAIAGPATLSDGASRLGSLSVSGLLTLTGGTFDEPPPGSTFSLAGGFDNTGATYVPDGGTLTMDGYETQALTSGGAQFSNLTVKGATIVQQEDPLEVSGTLNVASGTLDILGTKSTSVGSLTGAGTITGGPASLSVAPSSGDTFSGTLTGGVELALSSGALTLSGASTSSGTTSVNGGTLTVTGSLAGPVDVNGGTLDGTGSTGVVTATGGTVQPATSSTGILNTDGLSLGPGSTFAVRLDGPTASADYDQLISSDGVSLGGAALSVSLGYTPTVGQAFTVIGNSSGAPPSGAFAGLPEGSFVTVNETRLLVSYHGGSSGDDVTLTVVTSSAASTSSPAAPSASIAVPANGGTYIQDQSVAASYSCTDGQDGPGIASCSGSAPNGGVVNTSTIGRHTFTVAARSADGQTAATTFTYTVLRVAISHVHVLNRGVVVFTFAAPGPGVLDILETAPLKDLAGAPAAVNSGTGQFAIAAKTVRLHTAGIVSVHVKLNARGRRLLVDDRHAGGMKLIVTYTPSHGTKRTFTASRLRLTR